MDGITVSSMDTVEETKRKGISGSTLKLVAIITMLIDHTAAIILDNILIKKGMYALDWSNRSEVDKFISENGLLYNIDSIMRSIGRLAFPIFCFLLVEGIIHTHNKWKYTFRLALFALISEIPFDLAFSGKMFYWGYQSVYFTLLIGVLVMIGFEYVNNVFKDKKWLPLLAVVGAILGGCSIPYFIDNILAPHFMAYYTGEEISRPIYIIMAVVFSVIMILVYVIRSKKKSLNSTSIIFANGAILFAGMFLAKLLNTDYSAFGVLTIAIMYILRRNQFNSMLGGCLTLTIMSYGEISSLFDLLLIRLYNGKRGLNLKYVFYLFYPVHLFILYLICYFMKII